VVGEMHNPLATGDERFFVGESDVVSSFEGSNGRGETGETNDSVEDDVGGCCGEMCGGTEAGEDLAAEAVEGEGECRFEGYLLRFELSDLALEQFDVLAGGEADHVEEIGVGAHDFEGLATDAAG